MAIQSKVWVNKDNLVIRKWWLEFRYAQESDTIELEHIIYGYNEKVNIPKVTPTPNP